MPVGAMVGLEQTWRLAQSWYTDRLDPGWLRPTPAEAAAMLRDAGLEGTFWALETPPVE